MTFMWWQTWGLLVAMPVGAIAGLVIMFLPQIIRRVRRWLGKLPP